MLVGVIIIRGVKASVLRNTVRMNRGMTVRICLSDDTLFAGGR